MGKGPSADYSIWNLCFAKTDEAKDMFGAESDWGTPPIIIVPKNNNIWFLWLLDYFPLINRILKWLI